MKKLSLTLLLLLFIGYANAQLNFPMVPGTPVVHVPKSSGVYLGTPSLIILPNGDYLVSHDFFGPAVKNDSVNLYCSSDKGKTWQLRSAIPNIFWAGLFQIKDAVYLLGVKGKSRNLAIWKSTDNGKTWSAPYVLRTGHFHGSSTPVVFANGRIYKGYDHLVNENTKKWMSNNRSFIMSAPVNSDLTDSLSWTFSTEMAKPTTIDGTGWLETNVVQGPDEKIKGITRISNESGLIAGYYSLENDSTIDTSSVGTIDFIGGATKFNIVWDEKTKKYWSLSNFPPDVLREPKMRAGGMRSVLSLVSSPDLKTWKIQAIILGSKNVKYHGFQYVDFTFEGKDIVFLCRTGYEDGLGGADNAHNSNFITFHRIPNYKKVKTEKSLRYLLKK